VNPPFIKQGLANMDRQPDVYDRLGLTYAETRRSDPRIAARIRAALGDVRTVVNVGAGTGSYEPSDLDVTAAEPSAVMIAQRGVGSAPVRQASAEALPFADGTFDAAMAVLTVHHWTDLDKGLAELQRVARKVVIFCFSPRITNGIWITADYFPSMARLRDPDVEPDVIAKRLGANTRIEVVPLDSECTDGSGEAYWGRPEVYLDARVRAGMSCFTLLADRDVEVGIDRLAADLHSGAWDARLGYLRAMRELDCGHRLVIAQAPWPRMEARPIRVD
jgi:SAM-dependent methyltransferase